MVESTGMAAKVATTSTSGAATSVVFDPVALVAQELNLPNQGVAAVIALLNEGSTVPFIARYRKEVTGNLDEVQIRTIDERKTYLMELHERRETVIKSITDQGKMTDGLLVRLLSCTGKSELEDLYLPFKPKRRTRATLAREKGLEPLAERVLAQPMDGSDPRKEAQDYVNPDKGVADVDSAIAGARDIIAEIISEHADIRAMVRDVFAKEGDIVSEPIPDKTTEPTKYEQYYNFKEAVASIPSHRFLAIRRGEREGILRVHVTVNAEPVLQRMDTMMHVEPRSPWAEVLQQAIRDGYTRLLAPSVETDVRVDLKNRSDKDAVDVFANNLRNLLLAAPVGDKPVIGIDPGLRTGCKCVVLSATGKFLGNTTFYISRGDASGAVDKAKKELLALAQHHKPFAIAIGNGTGGRETEAWVRQVLKEANITDIVVVQVNESGASVYSASDTARDEFPDLDVTVRGAISIGRRLQDPLAELVKIDPKAIGVGQYQHDVHQPMLQRKLEEVIESCVNHVGVELNTASVLLLAQVAGIGPALAKRVVRHREDHGPFSDREALLSVTGFGPRAFQQAAGFLRVRGGKHPLDASAVHPERYGLVERMATDLGVALTSLIGDATLADKIDIRRYYGDDVGEFTLRDILAELKKPGRDPRATFEPPAFRDDVFELEHLTVGMQLEGVVTNVAAFGAFVDIGVHQDGLVHISELSNRYIKDPNEVVKVGDKLSVRVLEVDLARRRIALSAKDGASKGAAAHDASPSHKGQGAGQPHKRNNPGSPAPSSGQGNKFANNPFAKLRA